MWTVRCQVLVGVLLCALWSRTAWGQLDRPLMAPAFPGLGQAGSVGHLPSVGAVSEGIALQAPPGRKGFEPHAALLYNSAGGLAESGVGWQLEFGRIERSSRDGSPALSLVDKFDFHLAGTGAELVSLGGGEYRARIEGVYRRYTRVADHWEVRDATGNLYVFGETDATRVSNQVWMLDRIVDPNGNTIGITYQVDSGFFYPSVVRYTGHAPTGDPGANEIRFEYEPRTDKRITYSFGVEQRRNLRLTKASFFAEGAFVRRYALTYGESPANLRSLVAAIDHFASDETSVRARSYSYRVQTLGFGARDGDHQLPYQFYDADGRDRGGRTADVNGDTYLDVLDNGQNVWLGDGTGVFTLDTGWSASLAAASVAFVGGQGIDAGTRLVDVNGDQRPDLVVAASGGSRRVLLNTGSGWTADASYTGSLQGIQENVSASRSQLGLPCNDGGVEAGTPDAEPPCGEVTAYQLAFSFVQSSGDSSGVVPVDVNGDGLLDFVWSYQTTDALFEFEPPDGSLFPEPPRRATANVRAVYLNNGHGWDKNPTLSTALGSINPFVVNTQLSAYDVLDVNGDGIADIVNTAAPSGSDNRAVLLGTGTGWAANADYTDSLRNTSIVSLEQSKNQGLVPIDFNGDGLIDYLRADESIKIAYRNTGVGWVEDARMSANVVDAGLDNVNGDGIPHGFLFGDVNGDGISDLLQSKQDGGNLIRYALGPSGDLLTHASTPLGETFDLTYDRSSRFDNRGADGLQHLPLVLNVLTSITRSAGRGVLVGGTFTYAGGLYEDRNLRGFARADSVDFQGVRTVTRFQQSEPLAGQPSTVEISDATGVRRRTSLSYVLAAPAVGVTQVRPSQTDVETFDPGGSIHTRMRTTYDDFLNVIELAKDGDVDVPGDDARTVLTYATNAAAGIVNTVARTQVFDALGALRSESTVFYDDLPEGQVVRGNPTKFVDSSLSATEPAIVRTAAYDAFGNPIRLTDAAGSVSTIEYSHDATFKSKATDPLGRVRLTDTDPRFGVATRETDPNGQVTTRSYDAAGRLVRETLPGDETSPFGTRTITYSPLGAGQFFRIAATEKAGQPGTLDTVAFEDGFGRIHRIESEGTAGRAIVVALEYDDHGNVAQSSLPFFAGDPPPLVISARDALQRVVRQTQPDGTFDETHYSGKQRETIDRRGNHTVFLDDTQGNTIETRQFVAGSTLVTQRRFDVFSRLVETTDPVGQVTRIAYDGHGRRIRLEDPNTGTNRYVYDKSGNLVQQIDPAGRTTEFKYNLDGEILLKKLPTGQVISFKYGSRDNGVGRVIHVEDAAGNLDIRYDGRGQQIERERTVDRQTYRTRYEYDSLGRTQSIEYPDGFKVNYHFDDAGLVDRITDRHGDDVVGLIEHNALGRPTQMNFANGVESGFMYDQIGFTRSISTQDRRGRSLQNLIYDYDAEGNVTTITNIDKASRSQAFQYDEIQRLVHAVGGYGDQIYRYDAGSTLVRKGNLVFQRDATRRQQVICGIDLDLAQKRDNGIGNDPRLRACATELASPAGGLSADEQATVASILAKSRRSDDDVGDSLLLSYDKLGNLSTKIAGEDDFDHARDDTRSFVYDAENRLLRIESEDDHEHHAKVLEENVYDAGGQRIVRKVQLHGNGSDDETTVYIDGIFEIDSKHRARHIRLGTLVLATSTTPFGSSDFHGSKWDDPVADGLSRAACACSTWGRQKLSWAHGAVLSILAAVLISRSTRVRRSARSVRGGIVSSALAFWRRPLTVVTAFLMVGIQLANMGWSRRSEAGDSRSDPGEQRFYYHSDHLGNTNVITDEHGFETVRREYAPFGEQFVRDGERDLEISFNGHLFDKEVGLYYFGARHYDPVLGRFITPDSIVPDSSPQALHRYALNLNNPIRFVDPTGHDFWDVLAGVIVAVVLVAATIVTLGVAGVLAGAILTAVAIGAGIGALGAGIAALVLAANGTISSFWEGFSLTLVGGLVGAATGGTVQLIAQAAATALPAGSTVWSVFASHAGIFALGGSAIGGGAGAGVAIAHGSYDLVLLGWFFGAAIGAAIGLASGVGLSQGILGLQGASGFGELVAVAKLVGSGVSAAALALTTGYEGSRRLLKVMFKNRNFDKYKLPDRFLELALPLLAAGTFIPFIPPMGPGTGEQGALDTHPGAN